ncbi:3-oxoacyl-ACP reductase family protein [Streptomyces boncukensis]|uniref:3-oxoacyl-ACP reductase FabG n=1 Tax=Streptomyces boncukensis TaxID=2711219 RepID=A0A6G4WPR8_9ACTN|nr:3-oxoacyl-ACP reductase family protein [Streptomyces boncukensis]NGO67256.1 3-oxoacyl-ACP reductase FabG [Streptomyces boncukensis]
MSKGSLAGKAALVTGGSRGIGAATALRLAEEGADVALTYTAAPQRATDVVARIKAAGARAHAIRADLGDATSAQTAVEEAVAEFGRLDILVNNAGAAAMGPLEETSVQDAAHVLRVNVRGPYLVARAAVPHLPAGGRIINVASCIAEHVPFPGMTLYAMSKAAVTGLTKGLARELGGRGITVNQVAPGPVDTDMNPASGEGAEAQAALTALGRYGEPEEVADAVAYLAGDGARYVSAASLAVDGGFTA